MTFPAKQLHVHTHLVPMLFPSSLSLFYHHIPTGLSYSQNPHQLPKKNIDRRISQSFPIFFDKDRKITRCRLTRCRGTRCRPDRFWRTSAPRVRSVPTADKASVFVQRRRAVRLFGFWDGAAATNLDEFLGICWGSEKMWKMDGERTHRKIL